MRHQQRLYFLSALKALADENRLKMVALLMKSERNVSDLAGLMELSEPTTSYHLSKLRAGGFLHLRTKGNQRFYSLNPKKLEELKRDIDQIDTLLDTDDEETDDSWIDALPMSESDRKVMGDYTTDGRLHQVPAKQKKLLVILRWLATKFEAGVMYSERDVNAILTRYHEDYARLRRDLVDFGFLRRERGGGKYWVTPETEEEAD
jgi:DNA-binding transcriptional ArsR family regulator